MEKKFTKLLLASFFILVASSTSSLYAQCVPTNSNVGVFESYIVINPSGGGNQFYDMQATTGNPDFNGANLGTFACGGSLVIAGGENKTFKCSSCNVTGSKLSYRVYPTGSPSGSYTQINLPFSANLGTGCNGNDQRWQELGNTTNILSGGILSGGNYTIEVYSESDYNSCGTGTCYSSNGGANFKATFTVTPVVASINNNTGTSVLTCATGSIQLTASGGSTYVWSTGANTASIFVSSPVTTLTVTVTSPNGCTATATYGPITQNITPPTPGITTNTGTTVLTCATTSIILTATGGGTYEWDGGSTNAARTVSATGTYTVTVTDATTGCSASTQITITDNVIPPFVNSSSSPDPICVGSSTTLTATAPGSVTYSWQPGSLTGSTVSVSPGATTIYTVTGTRTTNGCTATSTVQVNVNSLTGLAATATPPTICQGASSTLNGSGATTYTWQPGALTGTAVSVSPSSTTTYTVTGTDANGCTATATVEVTVTPAPACQNGGTVDLPTCSCLCLSGFGGALCQTQCATGAVAGANSTDVCVGADIELTSSATGTTLAYSWSGPNSFTSTEQNPIISPAAANQAGTYTVTISNGCGSTSSSVTINVNTNPTITLTSLTGSVCQGATTFNIAYTGTTDSPDGYTLNPTPSLGYPNFTVTTGTLAGSPIAVTVDGSAAPGNYLFDLNVDNSNTGCQSSVVVVYTLTVLAPPTAGINNNSGTTVLTCAAPTISLTATGGSTYLWDGGSTSSPRVISAAGTYTVTVTDGSGCTASTQITITSNMAPPTVTITPSPATICVGNVTTLTANGASTYSWMPGSLTGTTVSVGPASTTVYTVTGTAANGCTATATVTVTVNPNPIINTSVKSLIYTAAPKGSAGVTALPSGCTFLWSPGGQTTNYIENQPTGSYTVTVTSPAGCYKSQTIIIN